MYSNKKAPFKQEMAVLGNTKEHLSKEFTSDTLPHLVERENELNALLHFLKILSVKKRGLLRIIGASGSGRTSLLSALVFLAPKYNYEVISTGTNGLQGISTGRDIFNTDRNDFMYYESLIYERIKENNKEGLVIIADDIGKADLRTRNLMCRLLSHCSSFNFALAYSNEPKAIQTLDYLDLPFSKTINITPLSPQGLKELMKTKLNWKPPVHFLEWFYNETAGLPKLINEGIDHLFKKEILITDNQNRCNINKEYSHISLSSETYKNDIMIRNNLPAELTQFIGREEEIEKIGNLLDNARLITLTGPGGIGKSRLSLQIARKSMCKYKDGVFHIPLETIAQPDLLIPVIAKALNIMEIQGQHTLDSIKSVLRNKTRLIVLDNFEHIIHAASVLPELLSYAPRLTILVTSREPLNINGEHLFSVPPLLLPDYNMNVSLEKLEKQPAVALFSARARAVRNDFKLSTENVKQIVHLCASLDGIPLAIELAAANIEQIPIPIMLEQSQNSLKWLKGRAQDLPGRHRTLKNTIEWGYNLLNEDQKKLFIRLGVFAGGFDLEAAYAVANYKNDIIDVNEELTSLVNKNLLIRKIDPVDSNSNYFNMLETIRVYASDLLSKSNEEDDIRTCHSDYYLSFAAKAEKNINGHDRQLWISLMDLAYPNIIKALEYFQTAGIMEKELKLAGILGFFWELRGYWSKGQDVLNSILYKYPNIPKTDYSVKLYRHLGRLVYLNGNYEKAIDFFEKGLILARETGSRYEEANLLYNLALGLGMLGNLKEEKELMQKSLNIFRDISYKQGISNVLQDLSQLYYFKGEYDQAEKLSMESMEISKETGDKLGISKALGRLGLVARTKGNFEQASKMLNSHLSICIQLDDKVGIANTLINIAELARSQGDLELAQDYYAKSLDLGYELGYKAIIARTLKDMGEIKRCKGHLKEARELFEDSYTVLIDSGDNGDIAWVYRNMAELELQEGNCLKSEELFLYGIKVYREIKQNTLIYIILVLNGLAGVSIALNQLERAACLFGITDRLLKTAGNLLAKNDVSIYEKRLIELNSKIQKNAFDKYWNEGSLMSLENALDYAVRGNEYNLDNAMAYKMINYIHENYMKDISLDDISDYFNMTPSYLSTMFKYYTGEKFKDYLNTYRVKKAKEILDSSNIKVNEVAKRVGCSNVITFIRMFKKYEGIAPGQYYLNQKTKTL